MSNGCGMPLAEPPIPIYTTAVMQARIAGLCLSVALVGCAATGADDEDVYLPEVTPRDVVRDGDAEPDGPRPDGIRLDVPLPEDYGLEVSEASDACAVRNPCGGCANLEASPGTPCDGCGGTYVCAGPDEVTCATMCSPNGCADSTREAFLNMTTYNRIAACAGGFQVAGLLHATPQCSRNAGNNSTNPNGIGCSIADLCAEGWRPCASPREVQQRTGAGIPSDFPAASFFAAAVSGPADDDICGIGSNDFYGLGTAGGTADRGTCAPLTRSSGDQCDDLPAPWDCGESTTWPNQFDEADKVTKPGPQGGGVLCCLAAG